MLQSQLTALKADIQANFSAQWAAGQVNLIAESYNANAVPDFIVWKTSLDAPAYRAAITWTEVDALTVSKARIFEWLTGNLSLPINPSDSNVRQGIADCFGAGTTTRSALLAASKRKASRVEKLFATGTGSDATPGTLVFEGRISGSDVIEAMNNG